MGIFKKIKGYKHHKKLAGEYREKYYREMDAKARLWRENTKLLEEAAEQKAAKEEWMKKYNDLLMKHTELGERMLRMIDEKGAAYDQEEKG